jgi:dihydropteroate synthase
MATVEHADYGVDLVGSVLTELKIALDRAGAAGISPDAIVLDPGLGFSKTPEQTLLLLDQVGALSSLGRPILVGPSRKRFLGGATGRPVEDRDRATATACVMASPGGMIARPRYPGPRQ